VLRWVKKSGRRKRDQQQIYTHAEFVRGGTIGSAKKGN